jgi:hypothetical protein
MSLAFCAYELEIGVEDIIDSFIRIAGHLGLSDKQVAVRNTEEDQWWEVTLDQLDQAKPHFVGETNYALDLAGGDLNKAQLRNSASYVSYLRTPFGDSMAVLSRQPEDLGKFAEGFMLGLPAKYGFGLDWSRLSSFLGYVHGLEDIHSLGGFLGESEVGRWGKLQKSEPAFFQQGRFRDIYPVNLLTNAHLDRETPDGTVRDLILEHKNWGGITPLAANWFMWQVPSDEIGDVKIRFEAKGLLE